MPTIEKMRVAKECGKHISLNPGAPHHAIDFIAGGQFHLLGPCDDCARIVALAVADFAFARDSVALVLRRVHRRGRCQATTGSGGSAAALAYDPPSGPGVQSNACRHRPRTRYGSPSET